MIRQSWTPGLIFACFAAFASQLAGQSTVVGKSCNLAAFGEKTTKAFLAFDHDFRDAIQAQDAGKLALLTQFPLRVDDSGGSILIPGADSLQGHFAKIFTPEIQRIILSSTRDSIWCNYTGISYGAKGEVWINVTDKGYFLMTINLPDPSSKSNPSGRKVQLACHTDARRVLIDAAPKGTPRLRAWNFDRSLFGPPDLEIQNGKQEWEGTGPCAHRVWTFANSSGNMTVEDADGCYGDDDQPPSGAQAQLMVSSASGKGASSWCF